MPSTTKTILLSVSYFLLLLLLLPTFCQAQVGCIATSYNDEDNDGVTDGYSETAYMYNANGERLRLMYMSDQQNDGIFDIRRIDTFIYDDADRIKVSISRNQRTSDGVFVTARESTYKYLPDGESSNITTLLDFDLDEDFDYVVFEELEIVNGEIVKRLVQFDYENDGAIDYEELAEYEYDGFGSRIVKLFTKDTDYNGSIDFIQTASEVISPDRLEVTEFYDNDGDGMVDDTARIENLYYNGIDTLYSYVLDEGMDGTIERRDTTRQSLDESDNIIFIQRKTTNDAGTRVVDQEQTFDSEGNITSISFRRDTDNDGNYESVDVDYPCLFRIPGIEVNMLDGDVLVDDALMGVSLRAANGNRFDVKGESDGTISISPGNSSPYDSRIEGSHLFFAKGNKIWLRGDGSTLVSLAVDNQGAIITGNQASLASEHVSFGEGNLYISGAAAGMIFQSPDNACWKVYVDDSGNLRTRTFTCPE